MTLKTLSPCTHVPGAQAVGLMCRETRTNGSVRRACHVPHTATGHMHIPRSNDFSRKKGSSPAHGEPRPKTRHSARPCFSSHAIYLRRPWKNRSVYVKKRFKSGMVTYSRKKRDNLTHTPGTHRLRAWGTFFVITLGSHRLFPSPGNSMPQVSVKRAVELPLVHDSF